MSDGDWWYATPLASQASNAVATVKPVGTVRRSMPPTKTGEMRNQQKNAWGSRETCDICWPLVWVKFDQQRIKPWYVFSWKKREQVSYSKKHVFSLDDHFSWCGLPDRQGGVCLLPPKKQRATPIFCSMFFRTPETGLLGKSRNDGVTGELLTTNEQW